MPKYLVFLMDGTGNDATAERFTNVFEINQFVSQSGRIDRKLASQITFYVPGIGTKFTSSKSIYSFLFPFSQENRQKFFGENLEQLVIRSYLNLCSNYRTDDRIIVVGFSRGAVASMIFCRFISTFGIMRPRYLYLFEAAWHSYVQIFLESDNINARNQKFGILRDELYREAGNEVFYPHKQKGDYHIDFLGLFDAVIGPFDNELHQKICNDDGFIPNSVRNSIHQISMHDTRRKFVLQRFAAHGGEDSNFKEIWMPGVHSDIGGGYENDFIQTISLLSMVHYLESSGLSVEKSEVNRSKKKIRDLEKSKRFHINLEDKDGDKFIRTTLISDNQNNYVHPLHYYLAKQNSVVWKNEGSVPYDGELRLPNVGRDPELEDWFESIVK